MFGYWKKIKDLEKRTEILEKRVKRLEEYMFKTEVDKKLTKYSEKYGIEILLSQNPYTEQYFLVTGKDTIICGLPCKSDMEEVYREMQNVEKNIKVFLYDTAKKVAEEISKEEGEEANDKE